MADTLPPVTTELSGLTRDLDVERGPVPSERETAAGVTHEFKPMPAVDAATRPRLRDRFRSMVRTMDPRDITGAEPKLPLLVMGLLTTVGATDNSIFIFLLVFIQADFGVNLSFLVRLMSVIGLVGTVLAPLGGYLADRVSRVWMVRIGALLDNSAAIVTGLAPTPGWLVGSRVYGSVGPAISGPAAPALMADYYPVHQRARVYGFMNLMGQAWSLISMSVLMLGFLVFGWTWRSLLVGTGVMATAVSLTTFLLREPIRGKHERIALGASEDVAVIEQKPVGWGEAWRATRAVGTVRKLWYATPFTSLGSISMLFVFLAMQERFAAAGPEASESFFTRMMMDPANARFLPVLIIAGPALFNAFFTPYATMVSDRLLQYRPGRIMVFAGALQLATSLIMILPVVLPLSLFWLFIVLQFAFGALGQLVGPARTTLMSLVVPPRIRAQAIQTIAPWTIVSNVIMFVAADMIGDVSRGLALGVLAVVASIGSIILMTGGADVEKDMRNALAASLADEEAKKAKARGQNKFIVARDVQVSYDGAKILHGIDLDVEEGEILAILGTNGAGKSTLLKAVAGIHEADGGAIFLDGEDITHKPAHQNARDGLVFLPGGRAVFPGLTVQENLEAAGWLYRGEDDWLRERREQVLDFFPILRERLHTRAGDLSGGEQQQVALAQAFLMRPRLLMIDELSLGLAPAIVDRLLQIVREINQDGTTVILVEQSINVALTIAERAIFLEKGVVRFDGSTDELLKRGDIVRSVFLGGAPGGFVGLGLRRSVQTEPKLALAVEEASVAYGGVQALREASLQVWSGEVVGIIGPNGAGKTTLFDAISGFTALSDGRIEIDGRDVSTLSPDARARLGLARSFQDARIFPSMTVHEALATALERRVKVKNPVAAAVWTPGHRKSEQHIDRRVEHLLELLNLGQFEDKFISELSTGSRRLVDLGCAMAAEPHVLLLDEPSGGLAQAEVEVLGPIVQRIARESDCGVLVIEHDMPLISEMADRLVAMELGTVIATGTPGEVLSNSTVLTSYLNADSSVINRSGDVLTRAMEVLGLQPTPAPEEH